MVSTHSWIEPISQIAFYPISAILRNSRPRHFKLVPLTVHDPTILPVRPESIADDALADIYYLGSFPDYIDASHVIEMLVIQVDSS